MSYFLFDKTIVIGSSFTLAGDEALHLISSRRIKAGEQVIIQDSDKKRFACTVSQINKRDLILVPDKEIETPTEPQLQITICQALVAEQALDIIIQKLTELGATRLIVFESTNSPASIKQKVESKLSRWNRISLEAAKQSDRTRPLRIEFVPTIPEVIKSLGACPIIVLDKEGQIGTKEIKIKNEVAVLVGPEGGLTEPELNLIKNSDLATSVRLGPRILRAETAALAITAVLQSQFGDFGK